MSVLDALVSQHKSIQISSFGDIVSNPYERTFIRADLCTFAKLVKIPCAVSGLRYATEAASEIAPTLV